MKVEQKSLEGVEGILSSMQEQEDGHGECVHWPACHMHVT